jgi:hypothetical protein
MPVTITKFLRAVLCADILFSTGGAMLMAVGAPFLAPMLNLPSALLFGAGLVLVPWIMALWIVVRRESVPRIVLIDIAGINLLWCAVCLALLASGKVAPNGLGVAFVVAQAITVAALGVLQFFGLRDAESPV